MDVTRDASSDAALFAFVAARLDGVWSGEDALRGVARRAGLKLSGRTLRTAPEKAARLAAADRSDWKALFPNTTTVPVDRLNLFEAAVRLRPQGRGSAIVAKLGAVTGVTEVLRLDSGELLAFVIYETRRDRNGLEQDLLKLGEIVEWSTVDLHTREPAVGTWLDLARRVVDAHPPD
jgi:hypothetical protein